MFKEVIIMDKNFLEYLLLMDDEKQEKYIQKYLDCIRKEKEKGTKHIDLDEFDHMFCNTSGIKDEIK